jgi:hypothetical protein
MKNKSEKLKMNRNLHVLINKSQDIKNRELIKEKLHKESKSIRKHSMEILMEMEKMIDGL